MSSTEPACFRVGDLLVDAGRRRVERDGSEIALPGLTFDLLLALAREAPNLASIDALMQQVWAGRVVSPETVSQRVKLLRAALGDDPESPRYLTGVRGHGYRLIVPVERCAIPTTVDRPASADRVVLAETVAPAVGAHAPQPVPRSPWPLALALVVAAGLWLVWSSLRESPVSQVVPATLEARPPSIAVLPFDNRSRLEEDVDFVDGLHDDILTQLTRIGGLTVISRTSVEQFRDTRLTTREIGAKLGVSRILEGGVQRAGDRVRVTVQLIDAATDAHLWAESYDRVLDAESIFAIQSEVATAVAAALSTVLTPAERGRVKAVPTRNLDAWEAYQAGRKALGPRTPAGLEQARQSFQAAIDLDPAFAQAYAGLADTIWLSVSILGLPIEPAVVEAEALLQEALRLDPELVEALTTTANFATVRHDYARAESGFRGAIALNSNYPTAHQWYAALLATQGRHAEALQSMQRAVELDPMSTLMRVLLASHLGDVGRFDEALAELNEAHERDPMSPLPVFGLGILNAYAYNRFGPAIAFGEKAVETDGSRPGYRDSLAQMYLDIGQYERAEETLDAAATETSGTTARGYLHLYRAEPEKALSSALRAVEVDRRDDQSLALLRDAALAADDPQSARALYERGFPELLASSPAIDVSNVGAAIDLALVLQKTGDAELAVELLRRAEAWVLSHPRRGPRGYGISAARIRLLLGQQSEALAMLQQAQQSGWRGPLWRYYRDFDPVLAPVRNDAEFKAVFAAIERDMARQRAELVARPPGVPASPVDSPSVAQ
jgi:TolB-like protein/DNA-binding winged helix-turn-helix (wHTH) protein/tetratricopeptide (TPR) repeat protein